MPDKKKAALPKEDQTKKTIRRMCVIAIFGALSFVLTLFARIPYPNGQGYFNFGDLVSLLSAMLFGPIEGAFVGILAGVLSDVFAGASLFVPWTILAKGGMGILTGLLFMAFKGKKVLPYLSPFLGSLIMVASYFFSYWVYFGIESTFYSLFDLIQGLGCAAIAVGLYLVLEKAHVTKILQI